MATRVETRLEDLTPGARVRGIIPSQTVTVVQVEWHGTQALTLTYRDDAGRVDHELLYRGERGGARDRGGRPRVELRRRREALPARLGGAAHPARAPVRSVSRGAHVEPRPAAAPDPRRLRRDAAAPAAALPARRRPGRRQDDHGRAADQGADRPRRPEALHDRRAGQPGRAVAGRAGAEARARVRDHHARHDRGVAERQPVRREEPRHLPGSTSSRATTRSRRSSSRPTGTSIVVDEAHKMSAHFFGNEVEEDQALPARRAARSHHAASAADDGDAAQRQARGLPALHGAARPRPLRGQAAQGRASSSTRRA